MKRPLGITVSALCALLGSLLMLAILVLITTTLLLSPGQRSLPREAMVGVVIGLAMFGVLGIWGTVTAIGLFRLRNWARVSMIVFSVLLAFGGLVSAPAMWLLPPPATVPPSFDNFRVVIAAIYGAFGLLGVFWLYYFSRRAAQEAFGGTSAVESGGRPLSISIIGWWLLIAGVATVLAAPLRMPGSVFIWIATGWAAATWYVAYGAMYAYAGYGLLRLKPIARKVAIWGLCSGAANAFVFFLWPGADARMAALISHFSFGPQTSPPIHFPALMFVPTTAIGVGLPLWFLITRRSAFQPAPLSSIPGAG